MRNYKICIYKVDKIKNANIKQAIGKIYDMRIEFIVGSFDNF
jgi:hypothetical protein